MGSSLVTCGAERKFQIYAEIEGRTRYWMMTEVASEAPGTVRSIAQFPRNSEIDLKAERAFFRDEDNEVRQALSGCNLCVGKPRSVCIFQIQD